MIALTTRLNERDEAILQMQEELDAFDKVHRESEAGRSRLKKRVGRLEDFLAKHKLQPPADEEDDLEEAHGRVKIGDNETFNVTTTNLLSPEQKIKELAELADNRKNEIDQLKGQLRSMGADQSNREDSRYASQQSFEDIGLIAASVNDIILKLSQQNSADVLKHVAKKLLDLQRFTADIMSGRKTEGRDACSRADSEEDCRKADLAVKRNGSFRPHTPQTDIDARGPVDRSFKRPPTG